MKSWVWISFSLALTQTLAAAEQTRIFITPRALGRGNTGVAAQDSNDSVRLNPALLSESSSMITLRPFQLEAVVGENSIDTVTDIMNLNDVGSDGLGFLRSFDQKFGKRQYLRGQLTPLALRIKSFEIQPIISTSSWLELRNPTTPQASFLSDSFAGVQASFGFQLPRNLHAGVTVRGMNRYFIQGDLSFTDIFEVTPPSQTKFSDLVPTQIGLGYGADFGMTWQADAALRLGLLVENIGDTAFTSSDENTLDPPNLLQKISFGGQYRLKQGAWDLDLSLEAQDIVNRQAKNLLQLLHMGAEFARGIYGKNHDVGLLAGIQEGYFTAGAFADLWLARLELSTYAVELGEGPGQRLDRRWAISLQSSISF